MVFQIVAAPSPKGTNHARIYVPAKVFGSGLAFDEMPPGPDDREAFFDSLDKIFGEEAEDDLSAAEERHYKEARKIIDAQTSSDEPPPFKGRPLKNGAMDSAAAKKSFEERFPEVARIRVDTYGSRIPPKPSKPVSAADTKRFNEMFPDAAKIKIR